MIDLQIIPQNLLTDNKKIQEFLNNDKNFDKPLDISSTKLAAKYPELKSLPDTILIRFIRTENGINTYIPTLFNFDGVATLFDASGKIINGFNIISYELTKLISSAIMSNGEIDLVCNVALSKSGLSKIAKSDNEKLDGKNGIHVILLQEKIPFIPIKDVKKGSYKLIKNTKKRTGKYNDLLVDLESLDDGEIIRYVAINDELEKLILKYKKDTKFSIIDYQNFTNKEGKNAVKVIIKDLNFEDDLSDLDLF